MYLQWYGQSFFKITTKNQKGEDVVLAIDPFNKNVGLKVPTKFGGNIVLISHDHEDHNNVELIKGTNLSPEPFVITGPGEYEVRGIMIYGIPSYHDDKEGSLRGENTIYLIELENMWLVHLGDLGQKTLNNEQLEELRDVDILLIPVGGVYTLNAKEANQIIAQIEPRIIIPMHYKMPGLKINIDGIEKFIKEIGLKPTEVEKLKVNKKDLSAEETSLVVLKL